MKNTEIKDYNYKGFIICSPDGERWAAEPKELESNECDEFIYNNECDDFKTINKAKKWITDIGTELLK